MEVKLDLAQELVARYHTAAAGVAARMAFLERFRHRQVPAELPQVQLSAPGGLMIGAALQQAGLVGSTSEALRLIAQGAVRVDGDRVEDPKRLLSAGNGYQVQIGKRRLCRIVMI